jgi:predicted dehydrogenase
MSGALKTAIFGSGFVARSHLDALSRLGAVIEVCGIASSDFEQARRLGKEYGIECVTSNYRELLESSTLDVVHVCTPNSLHFSMASDALHIGKHVVCEKPLATSVQQAAALVQLAEEKAVRNCTCYNLRFYPLVQQMRAMCSSGELGELLVVQGTYSQDWLLAQTDWNWRLDSEANGPSRAMADIGSHWCDMAEFVTGQQITSLCADLQTFHKTRRKPKGTARPFSSRTAFRLDDVDTEVDTEDFGAVIFRMGDRTRGAFTASQVAGGRKNRLFLEIFGTLASVAWDAENPNELWVGKRGESNRILIKDPALLHRSAAVYADLPGGHAEGYDGTFKQLFRNFYRSVSDAEAEPMYPQFRDGQRQLDIVQSELASNSKHAWIDVQRRNL